MRHPLKALQMRKAIIAIAVLNALWGSFALIASEELDLDHHGSEQDSSAETHAHHDASNEHPNSQNCSIEHCPFCFVSMVTGPLPEFISIISFAPVQSAQLGASVNERDTPPFFALVLAPRPPPVFLI